MGDSEVFFLFIFTLKKTLLVSFAFDSFPLSGMFDSVCLFRFRSSILLVNGCLDIDGIGDGLCGSIPQCSKRSGGADNGFVD